MGDLSRDEACCSAPEELKIEAIISIDERGQMILPKDIRDKAGLRPGDKLAVLTRERNGKVCCIYMFRTTSWWGWSRKGLKTLGPGEGWLGVRLNSGPPLALTTFECRDGILARLGYRRMHHRVEPGLYKLGSPTPSSPVFVSANYTLSFDALRSALNPRMHSSLSLTPRALMCGVPWKGDSNG